MVMGRNVFLLASLLLLEHQCHAQEEQTYGDLTFRCKSGWRMYQTNCYLSVQAAQTYSRAKSTCNRQGGNLLKLENDIEYIKFVSTLTEQDIWLDIPTEEVQKFPLWGNYQPITPLSAESCVSISRQQRARYNNCENEKTFVCKYQACLKDYRLCATGGKCIHNSYLCDGTFDCPDQSDERQCPNKCRNYIQTSDVAGSFSNPFLEDFMSCTWIIEVPPHERLSITIPTMTLETNVARVKVYSGSPSLVLQECILLTSLTGSVSTQTVYSKNNFIILTFSTDDISQAISKYSFSWTTAIPLLHVGIKELPALSTITTLTFPYNTQVPDLSLVWLIQAGEKDVITFYLEGNVADGDTYIISFRDGDEGMAYQRLMVGEYRTTGTNKLFVNMMIAQRNTDVSLRYITGCTLFISALYGTLYSPGHTLNKIPNSLTCDWTLVSGLNVLRGMTVKFNELTMHFEDMLQVFTDANKTSITPVLYSGSFGNIIHAEGGKIQVHLQTNAAIKSTAFKVTFGADCNTLPTSQWTTSSHQKPYYQETVDVSCEDGYGFDDEAHSMSNIFSFTCVKPNKSVCHVPVCTEIQCGAPPAIIFGYIVSITGTTLGSTAVYDCNSGFTLHSIGTPTCTRDRTWNNLPSCTSTQCTVKPSSFTLTNGQAEVTVGTATLNTQSFAQYGTVVEFKCNVGFHLVGPKYTRCIDSWFHETEGLTPRCEVVRCPVPENNNVEPHGPISYASMGNVLTCRTGYMFPNTEGSTILPVTCQSNGILSSNSNCIDIDECLSTAERCPENSVCENSDGSFKCICDEGYEIDSNTCNNINECTRGIDGCLTMNGVRYCIDNPGSYRCTCPDGWELFTTNGQSGYFLPSGQTGYQSSDTFRFDHTCVRTPFTLGTLTNGKYLTIANKHYYGDTVTVKCNDGYMITGSSPISERTTITADVSGFPEVSCSARTCVIPTNVSRGTFSRNGSISFGESVILTCTLSITNTKTKTAYCIYENSNTGLAGQDVTSCPDIDCGNPSEILPPRAIISGTGPIVTTYPTGTFTFDCGSGFTVEGSSGRDTNTQVVCKENGRWQLGTLTCKGVKCQDPGTPADARQVVSGYEVGQKLSFSCNRPGFLPDMNKPKEYICQLNGDGTSASWSGLGTLPVCQDAEPPTVNNCPGSPIYVETMGVLSFTEPSFTDNFAVQSITKNDNHQSGDFIDSPIQLIYTATDFENSRTTCSMLFQVIYSTNRPLLDCPSTIVLNVPVTTTTTMTVSTMPPAVRTSWTAQNSTISPSTVSASYTKIGSYEPVVAIRRDERGSETKCPFVVRFQAGACFSNRIHVDNNANRICDPSPGPDVSCQSTCKSSAVYRDGSTMKTFLCSNSSSFAFASPDYCLPYVLPKQSFQVGVTYEIEYDNRLCLANFNESLMYGVSSFTTKLRQQCSGSWSVSSVYTLTIATSTVTKYTVNFIVEGTSSSTYGTACTDAITAATFDLAGQSFTCVTSAGSQAIRVTATLIQKKVPVLSCVQPQYTIISTDGQIVCVPCSPGQFYSSTTSQCTNCPDGRMQDLPDQTQCKDCPIGQQPNSAKTACINSCPVGFFSTTGSGECFHCPENKYSTSPTVCTDCPAGYSTVGKKGAKSLNECFAESCFSNRIHVDNYANRNCDSSLGPTVSCQSTCRSGAVYRDGSVMKTFFCSSSSGFAFASPDYCLPYVLPKQSFQVGVTYEIEYDNRLCLDSFRGSLSSGVSFFTTKLIQQCSGSWSVSSEYILELTPLTVTKYTVTFVVEGTSLSTDGTACRDAITATTFDLAGQSFTCTSQAIHVVATLGQRTVPVLSCVQPQYTMISTAGQSVCVSCRPGQFYNSTTSQCTSCPERRMQDLPGQTQCKECPIEQQPNFAKTACITPCPAGQYSPTGFADTTCRPCPLGSYQTHTGQRSCTRCSASMTTTSTGTISDADCVAITLECTRAYCSDHGECAFQLNRRHCTCDEGYSGITCAKFHHKCEGNPCKNGGTCVRGASAEAYTCICRSDLDSMIEFQDRRSGPATTDINTGFYDRLLSTTLSSCKAACLQADNCLSMTFLSFSSSICYLYSIQADRLSLTNETRATTFRKSKGFAGTDCDQDLINECTSNQCDASAMCMNKIGGYQCLCPLSGGLTGQYCTVTRNPCNPNPCLHGTCQPFGNIRYECTCSVGWKGINCTEDIDECSYLGAECLYGGTCVNSLNGFSCNCLAQYSGSRCQITPNFCAQTSCPGNLCYNSLIDNAGKCHCDGPIYTTSGNTCNRTEPCDAGIIECGAHGECRSSGDSAFCTCDVGYAGLWCEHNVNYCQANSCNGHGTCVDGEGTSFTCNCDQGYEGDTCDVNVNECQPDNNCRNGATCRDGINTYTCQCAKGFTGDRCETNINDCASVPCKNGGTCEDLINDYRCTCPMLYTGINCQTAINSCSPQPCQNKAPCFNLDSNNYFCRCARGTLGLNCESLYDVCKVLNENLHCKNNGVCRNSDGTAVCTCPVESIDYCYFQVTNDKSATTGSMHTTNSASSCLDICKRNPACRTASITRTVSNSYLCRISVDAQDNLIDAEATTYHVKICPLLYDGKVCELINDACTPNPCMNEGTCQKRQCRLGFTCRCAPGYRGIRCETRDDPCMSAPCGTTATCTSLVTEYICQCPQGKMLVGTACRTFSNDFVILGNSLSSNEAPKLQRPFRLEGTEMSIMLRFRVHQYSESSVIATLQLQNSLTPEKLMSANQEGMWLKLSPGSITTYYNGFTVTHLWNDPDDDVSFNVFDHQWHHLGISITAGQMKLTIDAITVGRNAITAPAAELNFAYNGQVLLGSNILAEYEDLVVWNKGVEQTQFIDAYKNMAFYPRSDSIVQHWWNYYIPQASERQIARRSNLLSPGTLREMADILSCADIQDVSYVPTNLLVNIGQVENVTAYKTEVTNQATNGQEMKHTLPTVMTVGYYPGILVRTSAVGEPFAYDYCKFGLYIKHNENCPGHRFTGWSYTSCYGGVCQPSCALTISHLSAPTPIDMACGSLGVWNPDRPKQELVLPSCQVHSFPKYVVDVDATILLQIPCMSSFAAQIETRIKSSFFDLETSWDGLCVSAGGQVDTCTNVRFTLSECLSGTNNVRVKFSVAFRNPTITRTGGTERINVDDVLRILILQGDDLRVNGIGNGAFVKDTVDIMSTQKCDIRGDTLIRRSTDQNVCVPCGEGFYVNATTGVCTPCGLGKYQSTIRAETCTGCPQGKTTYQFGARESTECAPICHAGHFYNFSAYACAACSRNTYQQHTGESHCEPCTMGYRTVSTGSNRSDDCKVDCPGGQYRNADLVCTMCERGSWRSVDNDDCQQCSEGKTTMENVLADSIDKCNIDICPLGHYWSATERLCQPCPIGQYADVLYLLECKHCPVNHTTRNTNTASGNDCILQCVPGQYSVNDACKPCPIGTFKSETGNQECTTCAEGVTTGTTGAIRASQCDTDDCNAGYGYDTTEQTCKKCPVNFFNNKANPYPNTCKSCPYTRTNTISGSTGCSLLIPDPVSPPIQLVTITVTTIYQLNVDNCETFRTTTSGIVRARVKSKLIQIFEDKAAGFTNDWCNGVGCPNIDVIYTSCSAAVTASRRKRALVNSNFEFSFRNISQLVTDSENGAVINAKEILAQTLMFKARSLDLEGGINFIGFETIVVSELCLPGQYRRSTECMPCPQGTYSLGGDYAQCSPCQLNYYQDLTGAAACKQCPPLKYTDTRGSVSSDVCRAHDEIKLASVIIPVVVVVLVVVGVIVVVVTYRRGLFGKLFTRNRQQHSTNSPFQNIPSIELSYVDLHRISINVSSDYCELDSLQRPAYEDTPSFELSYVDLHLGSMNVTSEYSKLDSEQRPAVENPTVGEM